MSRKEAKQQTMGWEDKVPEQVQEAADAYEKALKTKNNAAGKFNTAKDVVIAKMKEHGVTKVRIRDGSKYLELSVDEKVRIHKIKEPTAAVEGTED